MSAATLPGLFPALPLADQITEVEREIAMRKRTYPKWILSGRLDEGEADVQMARMEAVLATLRGLS